MLTSGVVFVGARRGEAKGIENSTAFCQTDVDSCSSSKEIVKSLSLFFSSFLSCLASHDNRLSINGGLMGDFAGRHSRPRHLQSKSNRRGDLGSVIAEFCSDTRIAGSCRLTGS